MQSYAAHRVRERDVAHWDAACDVLVVGFGAAGASAAFEAASAGAEVLVLERAGGPGGTSAMSGGIVYLGGGTPIQKACGYDDTPEEMFKYMMAACGPGPDEALIRPYCEHSVEHFHWLVARGVPYKPEYFPGNHEPFTSDEGLTFSGSEHVHPFKEIAKPAPRGHIPQQVQNKGSLLMRHLVASAEAAGATTRVQMRVEALVLDDDESVVGAVAHGPDGTLRIRARGGVVLTAGGFVYDDAMLARCAPQLARCRFKVGSETDDGSGVTLGVAAGGEAIRMETGDISLVVFPPNQMRAGIFVNQAGQRYLNEDAYMGRCGEFTLLQQDGRAYLVVDDEMFVRGPFPVEIAAVGETIEELETELGLPASALQETVAYYNRHAAEGEDPLFHKSAPFLKPLAHPPFAAIDLSPDAAMYSVFTLGGLHIDADARVLRPSGDPIPGLYAAGRTTSGIAKQGYSSGMSLGDGTFFGRRAGRNAAAER